MSERGILRWPKALIFDVDGTLAETEELHRASFNDAFAALDLGWNWSIDEYRRLLRTTGGKERIAAYAAEQSTAGEIVASTPDALTIPAIHVRKTQIYTAAVATGRIQYKAGIVELIRFAHDAGVRLAIATTTSRANVEALLAANRSLVHPAWFEAMACGDEVRRKKPSPDVYALATERLGVPAADCIAVEDSWSGVKAAREAGLWVAAISSHYLCDDDLSEADLRIDSAHGLLAKLQILRYSKISVEIVM